MLGNYPNKMMGKPTRDEQKRRFLEYCEKIGYGTLDHIEISDGVPYFVERVSQKIRFDLSENKGNSTFDLTNHKK